MFFLLFCWLRVSTRLPIPRNFNTKRLVRLWHMSLYRLSEVLNFFLIRIALPFSEELFHLHREVPGIWTVLYFWVHNQSWGHFEHILEHTTCISCHLEFIIMKKRHSHLQDRWLGGFTDVECHSIKVYCTVHRGAIMLFLDSFTHFSLC